MGVDSGAAIPIAEEHHALAEAIADFALGADVRATVRAQADDAGTSWRKHWTGLAELGVFGVPVPESLGGGGGDLLDAAVAAEACAAELVPGPVLPTLLGATLLGSHPVVADVAAGRVPLAVATGLRSDGDRVSGEATVLGADERGLLLAETQDGWFLINVSSARVTPKRALDPSCPIATVRLADAGGERIELAADATVVTDVLVAAECAGIAAWCLRTAVDYARTREQFGKPVGTFQAVKLLCTDLLCAKETTAALAWDAAKTREPLPAAAARASALTHAVEAAKGCVQVLGGIGYTWEHDAHLYLRRALALRQWFGTRAEQRVGKLALDGHRRSNPEAAKNGVAGLEGIAELAELSERDRQRELAERGLLMPHYPRPYGLDADAETQLAIDAELRRCGIERPDLVVGAWAAPTILSYGSQEQRDRFIMPTLRGDIIWCQLFSEPEAGSDLAGLRTKASRTEGGWLLTGQKVWTSMAERADWAICLARTDPEAPKHKGITYFLVDMSAPGITVRPLREITGEALFNEVFLDEVFVPDDHVVGEVNQGWKLARSTLANERVALSANASFDADFERLLELAGSEPDTEVLATIGGLACGALSVRALESRGVALRLAGAQPGAESAVRKLVGVAHRQRTADRALWLSGVDGVVAEGESGELSGEMLRSRALSIAGGSTQVLGVHAAERMLGLPRD